MLTELQSLKWRKGTVRRDETRRSLARLLVTSAEVGAWKQRRHRTLNLAVGGSGEGRKRLRLTKGPKIASWGGGCEGRKAKRNETSSKIAFAEKRRLRRR